MEPAEDNNVSYLPVVTRSKTVREQYRGQLMVLIFDQEAKKWKYEVRVRKPVDHLARGRGYNTEGIAKRYAREAINKLLDGEK